MSAMDPNQIEESVARSFLRSGKKERVSGLLKSKRGRAKFLDELYHFYDFDPRWVVDIPASRQNVAGILALLKEMGAPRTCYAISVDVDAEGSPLDGREVDLEETLQHIVGTGWGTILSCIPGRLGFYEGEDLGRRVILWNPHWKGLEGARRG